MSRLFQLGEDDFRHILSWLDISSIRFLDVAVGNKKERSWWFDSLHTMDNKSINEYMYCHTSIRWLIERGARATGIQVRATSYQEREFKRNSSEHQYIESLMKLLQAWVISLHIIGIPLSGVS